MLVPFELGDSGFLYLKVVHCRRVYEGIRKSSGYHPAKRLNVQLSQATLASVPGSASTAASHSMAFA